MGFMDKAKSNAEDAAEKFKNNEQVDKVKDQINEYTGSKKMIHILCLRVRN